MTRIKKKPSSVTGKRGLNVDDLLLSLSLTLLVAIPLAFSSVIYTRYTLPKFVVLVIGSSVLLLLLVLRGTRPQVSPTVLIGSRLVWLVFLYYGAVLISTIFGVAPLASVFGSHYNFMGLITRVCFVVVMLTLIAGIGVSQQRLRVVLWGITATGFLVAIYATAQSFGVEPFVSPSLYTFRSPQGPLVRVSSTLGHSDYLGNFLLYTTPVSVALAFAERGWGRLMAIAAAALSTMALVFSGTRGAWLGIVCGGIVFAFLEFRSLGFKVIRLHPIGIAVFLLLALLITFSIVLSPVSQSVVERMRAVVKEGVYSSGRVVLWRDSLRMVPAFPFVGCGPEGYRKAFLGFKSKALAQLSPKANNESPHNAYLDVAISHGVAGAVLYIAIIVVALRLLIRARDRVADRRWRFIVTGLISAFVAVLVHNIFIFDQIATGLYFFAFLALSQAASYTEGSGRAETGKSPSLQEELSITRRQWVLSRGVMAGAIVLIIGSCWYSAGLIRSDRAYRELFESTNPSDFDRVEKLGARITSSPLPTGAYDFVFAREVDSLIKRLSAQSSVTGKAVYQPDEVLNNIRSKARTLGILHAEKSLANTLTPELNYSILASLSLAAGDVDRLKRAASEAVRWDPNNYYTRSLMAEAYLVSGEPGEAEREAEIALDLYHVSPEAASVLARARGGNPSDEVNMADMIARLRVSNGTVKRSVEELIERGRKLAAANKLRKAQIKLLVASYKAEGPCPECHYELAIVYEKLGRNTEAIAQWQKFIDQSSGNAMAEQARLRVEVLRQRSRSAQ